MEFISGEDRKQIILFPDSIDEYVDENSTVRVIEAYIDSLDLYALGFSRARPKETGRPPYDPKDILKLYVYGYMNRIRSSRRLEAESKRNLEVLWLLRKLTPDHKTIANFRCDNGVALKNVFRDFVKLCMKMGLYGKELAAVDGSKFKAVNSKGRNFTKDKLKKRLEQIEKKIGEYLEELDQTDREEEKSEKEKSVEEIRQIVEELNERKRRYKSYEEELVGTGQTQKSLTDSESRLMSANGKLDVCYNVQTAVDAKNKLIVEFEVTNNANDLNLLTPVAAKAQEILDVERIAVAADIGYNSASDITAALRKGIDPHVAGTDYDICVPVEEGEGEEIKSHVRGRCVYLPDRNIALCPMGKMLYPKYYNKSSRQAVYNNSEVCKACTCRCTAPNRGQKFEIVIAESDFTTEYNDKDLNVRQVHIKPNRTMYKQRKSLCEHPFGTIKRSMDGGYCLTKGIKKVSAEFSLTFLAYNLKRVINILGCKGLIEGMAHRVCPT